MRAIENGGISQSCTGRDRESRKRDRFVSCIGLKPRGWGNFFSCPESAHSSVSESRPDVRRCVQRENGLFWSSPQWGNSISHLSSIISIIQLTLRGLSWETMTKKTFAFFPTFCCLVKHIGYRAFSSVSCSCICTFCCYPLKLTGLLL